MPKLARAAFVVSLALLFSTGRAGAETTFPLRWPVVNGWRSETIPFPLEFAPRLAYTGLEELRFSPGFGKPGDAEYFTYAFVWVVGGAEGLTAAKLEADLAQYFDGLMTAVADARKLGVKVPPAKVSLAAAADKKRLFEGTVETFDAFFARKPLALKLEVREVPCALPGQRVLYFNVSPNLRGEVVRKALAEVEARLACP